MQITREVSLKDAVDIIQGFLDHLSDGNVAVGDNEVKLEHPVTIQFEIESSTNELELEFEIKWKVPNRAPATPSRAAASTAPAAGTTAVGASS